MFAVPSAGTSVKELLRLKRIAPKLKTPSTVAVVPASAKMKVSLPSKDGAVSQLAAVEKRVSAPAPVQVISAAPRNNVKSEKAHA